MSQPTEAPKNTMQRILDVVEQVGNKVPHPVIIFLILIAIVVVLSAVLSLAGTSVSYEVFVPQSGKTETSTAPDASVYDTGTAATYQTRYKIERRTVQTRNLLSI